MLLSAEISPGASEKIGFWGFKQRNRWHRPCTKIEYVINSGRMALRRRVAVVGPTGAGKSSLINQRIRGSLEHVSPTIGYQFEQIPLECNGVEVLLDIFDTAGQERFHSFVPVHLRRADAVIVVFDQSDRASFETVAYWNDIVRCHAPEACLRVLSANKCDLESVVTLYEIEALRESLQFDTAFITSAKTGHGVDDLFRWIVGEVVRLKDKKTSALAEAMPEGRSPMCACWGVPAGSLVRASAF
jgi:small GTP-binding protein